MTESAKQDTVKEPAEPAATESAATQGETAHETAHETAGPETAAGPGEGAAAGPAQAAKPDLDETKRKFREALERKHQAHSENQARGGRDGGKVSGAHGPAATRRNFRRKSG